MATDYRLYLTDFTGDTLRVVERPYEPIPLAKSQHDSATAQARAMRRAMRDELRRHPRLPPAPDYEPIFSGFVEDDEGYLWVILTPPLDAEGSLLDVFDPAGRYLGSVTAPYNLEHKPRPVIHGSKLYAITKDELDVPYVVALNIDGRE